MRFIAYERNGTRGLAVADQAGAEQRGGVGVVQSRPQRLQSRRLEGGALQAGQDAPQHGQIAAAALHRLKHLVNAP